MKMMWRANGVHGMGPPKVRLFFMRMDRHDRECWSLDDEPDAFGWTPSEIDRVSFLVNRKQQP